jgi:hypothetical protein
MGRYSDINRGPELQDAYEKYQEWLKKSRAAKKAAYKTVAKPAADRVKVERIVGYVLPFNSDNDKVYLETRIISDTQTGAGSDVAGTVRELVDDRALKVLPTTDGIQSFQGENYRFAKIIASKRTTTATDDSESRITGDTYKRHRSNNVSSPFGRKTATDNYSDAVKAIKAIAAFKTFAGAIGNHIGFKAEG